MTLVTGRNRLAGVVGSWALVAIALLFVTQVFAEPSRQRELGDVDWERDFSRAEARAQQTGLPMFALFQEVPGCQTCVGFGEQVLNHLASLNANVSCPGKEAFGRPLME